LRPFQKAQICPRMTNSSGVHWKWEMSVLDRSNCLDNFGLYAHFQKNSERTPNTKILGNFVTFLTVGITQNSNLKQRNYDRLMLNNIMRYDCHFELISSFFRFLTFARLKGFQCSSYSRTCICNIKTYVSPICSSPKEKLCQIYMTYV
jgi:hypothetical protein